MIHEEIVTYEVAKLAKEKGFPLQKVIKQNGRAFFYELPQSHPDWANCDAWYLPTQNLLQRWLREEKRMHISIPLHKGEYKYFWAIDNLSRKKKADDIAYNLFATYELALEDALAYSLKNLL